MTPRCHGASNSHGAPYTRSGSAATGRQQPTTLPRASCSRAESGLQQPKPSPKAPCKNASRSAGVPFQSAGRPGSLPTKLIKAVGRISAQQSPGAVLVWSLRRFTHPSSTDPSTRTPMTSWTNSCSRVPGPSLAQGKRPALACWSSQHSRRCLKESAAVIAAPLGLSHRCEQQVSKGRRLQPSAPAPIRAPRFRSRPRSAA